MLSPTLNLERDPKPSPTDCKGFVRMVGADDNDSELAPTLTGREAGRETELHGEATDTENAMFTLCFQAVS